MRDGTFNALDGIDYEDVGDIRDAGILGKSEIPGLDWIVVGGESGPGARGFNLDWCRSILRQCQAAGVPVFVKQLGAGPYEKRAAEGPQGTRAALANIAKPPLQRPRVGKGWTLISHGEVSEWVRALQLKNKKGGDINEWPEDLRVREFPKAKALAAA
jgi:hypothetical protein